jgi:uncharacterized protein YaaW (UPF0174 family)
MQEVRRVLAGATQEELQSLARVLECKPLPVDIVASFQRKSAHWINRTVGNLPPYLEILQRVVKKQRIRSRGSTAAEIENEIARKYFSDLWSRWSDEQKASFDQKLSEQLAKSGRRHAAAGTALTGAALVAGNLGGFATYVLASTVVGALTSALSLTLPFAAYTAMSSAISTILGPAGWIGLGLFAIWKLGQPDMNRVLLCVLMVHACRARQDMERQGSARPRGWIPVLVAAAILGILLVAFLLRLSW